MLKGALHRGAFCTTCLTAARNSQMSASVRSKRFWVNGKPGNESAQGHFLPMAFWGNLKPSHVSLCTQLIFVFFVLRF